MWVQVSDPDVLSTARVAVCHGNLNGLQHERATSNYAAGFLICNP